MKMAKQILSIMLVVVTLVSIFCVSAEALRVVVYEGNDEQCGYMVPTNSKGTKDVSTAKVYGSYDYINFHIKSPFVQTNYYFYEIYSDKKLTKCVQSGSVVIEEKGDFSYSPKLKLKGKYKSKTYYVVTYAGVIEEYSPELLIIDAESVRQFKLQVDRTTSFIKQKVMLKETKNTTKGAYIKWSKLSGANKYYIYRRHIDGTKWTKVGSVSKSKTSFTDTSVKNKNGNYRYTVKAVNKQGKASKYHYAGLVCLFAKTPIMESVSVSANNAITVEWEKTSSKAKYKIMRKTGNGSWKTIKTNYSGTSYKDSTTKPGRKYTYSVKAVLSTDYGKTTSSYYANESKAITLLGAPKLKDVALTETGVKVTWGAVKGVRRYTVLRRPHNKSEGWTTLGTVDANTIEFTDTTADLDSAYIYTVRSEGKKYKDSYYSAGIEFVVLDAPTKINYRYVSDIDGATISWETVDFANQYNVYIANEAGEWELYKTVSHKSGKPGYELSCRFVTERTGSIKYAVTALYNNNYETPINTVYEMDYYPWVVTTANITVNGMVVYWTDKGAQSYNIYRRTGDENSEFVLIDTVEGFGKGTSMKYIDNSVADYTAYTYMVKGVYDGVEQTTCYKESTTYSRLPEFAITRNEKVTFLNYEHDGEIHFEMSNNEIPVEIYGYDYKKNKWVLLYNKETDDTLIKVANYNLAKPNRNGEYTVSVVYNVDGNRTAFDANVVTGKFREIEFDAISAKTTSQGLSITFDAIEGAKEYIVTYTDYHTGETKKVVVEENGKKSYTIPWDFDVFADRKYHFKYTIDVVFSDLNISRRQGQIDVGKTPDIYKIKRNDDGTVTLYWDDFEPGITEYKVYRQVEGSTKWRTYDMPSFNRKIITGKNYMYLKDNKAKAGVKYTYKVVAAADYWSDPGFWLELDSYYELVTIEK